MQSLVLGEDPCTAATAEFRFESSDFMYEISGLARVKRLRGDIEIVDPMYRGDSEGCAQLQVAIVRKDDEASASDAVAYSLDAVSGTVVLTKESFWSQIDGFTIE